MSTSLVALAAGGLVTTWFVGFAWGYGTRFFRRVINKSAL